MDYEFLAFRMIAVRLVLANLWSICEIRLKVRMLFYVYYLL